MFCRQQRLVGHVLEHVTHLHNHTPRRTNALDPHAIATTDPQTALRRFCKPRGGREYRNQVNVGVGACPRQHLPVHPLPLLHEAMGDARVMKRPHDRGAVLDATIKEVARQPQIQRHALQHPLAHPEQQFVHFLLLLPELFPLPASRPHIIGVALAVFRGTRVLASQTITSEPVMFVVRELTRPPSPLSQATRQLPAEDTRFVVLPVVSPLVMDLRATIELTKPSITLQPVKQLLHRSVGIGKQIQQPFGCLHESEANVSESTPEKVYLLWITLREFTIGISVSVPFLFLAMATMLATPKISPTETSHHKNSPLPCPTYAANAALTMMIPLLVPIRVAPAAFILMKSGKVLILPEA